MKYSIIIPTYNHCNDLLVPCIESIIKTTTKDDQYIIDLIVVVNGCTDNTLDYINHLYKQEKFLPFKLHVIYDEKPLGYTVAVNKGINLSLKLESDYTILMNNDVKLLDFGQNNKWIDMLRKPFDENIKVGMSGTSKIMSEITKQPFIIFYMAMIKTKLFEELGLLDEVFNPGFGEDIDFSMRLLSKGYILSRVPSEGIGYDYAEYFPLAHDAEKTMHDENSKIKQIFGLSWQEIISRNEKILKEKYNENKIEPLESINITPVNNNVKYSIIIPTYNHFNDLLKPCLDSIIEYTDLNDAEIIIVANGCEDNTKSGLIEYQKYNFKVLWYDQSLGYTKAINAGIKESIGEYVILLNNDAIILNNNWIDLLEEPFHGSNKTAITGPLLEEYEGHTYLLFFCVMFKKSLTNEIGLLNEAFNPGGFEDVEYCVRAKKFGYNIYQVPNKDTKIDHGTIVGNFPIHHIGGGTVRHIEGWKANMLGKKEILDNLIKNKSINKVYDCFLFFNELDLLELRLNTLNDFVDFFVIVEGDKTHSGKTKPLYFKDNAKRFEKFKDKIIHIEVTDFPDYYPEKQWDLEVFQRDAILRGLTNCSDNDIIIISDIDEIINPIAILDYNDEFKIASMEQNLYYYYVNCLCEEKWVEPKIASYKYIKGLSPSKIRYEKSEHVIKNGGWHFSFLGGIESIINKVESYCHQEYNNDEYKNYNHILNAINNGLDLFKRNIKYDFVQIDNTYPDYLLQNLDYYENIGYIKNINENNKSVDEIKEYVLSVGSENLWIFGGTYEGGYRIQQDPDEISSFLFDYQKIKINNYLEIGVATGGLTRLMCDVLSIENVYTLDLGIYIHSPEAKEVFDTNISNLKNKGTVKHLIGDSHSTAKLQELISLKQNYDFIFIDGDHTYRGAKEDLLLAMLFAANKCLIVFHDHIILPELNKLYNEIKNDEFNGLELINSYISDNQTKKGIAVFSYDGKQNEISNKVIKVKRLELFNKYFPHDIVNIIVPTYNRHFELRRALESIESQTYDKIKVWVCADGPDSVVEDMVNNFNDISEHKMYHYLALPEHEGLLGSKPRMMGIDAIDERGVVCFVDDDNIIYPTFVEKLFNKLRSDNSYQDSSKIYDPSANVMSYCIIKHSHSPHEVMPLYGHVEGMIEFTNIDTLNIMVNSYIAKQCKEKWQHIEGNPITHDFDFIKACSEYGKSVFLPDILAEHLMSENKKPKVYDCFLFYDEFDVLTVRLNELNNVVDYFVIVESNKTFTGKDKPYYFQENSKAYKIFEHKIIHIKLDDSHQTFNNTWDMEHHQRDQIYQGLNNCNDDDIIMISDVDEIPSAAVLINQINSDKFVKIRQKIYYYYLNCESDHEWFGTRMLRWKDAKFMTSTQIRSTENIDYIDNGGWHFSYLGGVPKIINKIESFSHQEFNNDKYKNHEEILHKIHNNIDLFNRAINYKIVDIDTTFPKFVVENEELLINHKLIKITKQFLEKNDYWTYQDVFKMNLYDAYTDEIKGKTLIDIGANFGYFTLKCFMDHGLEKSYCFEPETNNFDKLIKYTQNYNVICEKIAILDGSKNSIKISNEGICSSIFGNKDSDESVPCISFQEVLTKHNLTQNDLILKIDCEGSEYEIILNTPKEIIKQFETIFIEMHNTFNPNYVGKKDFLREYIKSLGYEELHSPIYAGVYFDDGTFKASTESTDIFKYKRLIQTEKKHKVYDCFMFFDELDVLEIRLNELNDVVDKFIIVESVVTHSGNPKPMYFKKNEKRFERFKDKIVYIEFEDVTNICPADVDINWWRESKQRDACIRGLQELNCDDFDIIISGDADEIPNPEIIKNYDPTKGIVGVETKYFFYYLNCLREDKGTTHLRLAPYHKIRDFGFCFFRYKDYEIIPDGGWHFSFIGNVQQIQKKLQSYAHQEYNTDYYTNTDRLSKIIEEGGDILEKGMKFNFVEVDETFPKYLINNINKFKHIIKTSTPINNIQLKLNLGCGDEILEGYLNCDIISQKADLICDVIKLPFPNESVDEIRAYHLIEHFSFSQGMIALKEWFRVLKKGGKIIIETPDFLNLCKKFIISNNDEQIKLYPAFFAFPDISIYETHFFLFTETQLRWELEISGFTNIQRVLSNSIHAQNLGSDLILNIIAYK